MIECQDCRFWAVAPDEDDQPSAFGRCRRYAPKPGDGEEAFWPATESVDFCGEGRALEKEASSPDGESELDFQDAVTKQAKRGSE